MRKYLITFVSRGLVIGLTAVFGVLSSRLLGPGDKGSYTVVTLVPAAASTIAMLTGPQFILGEFTQAGLISRRAKTLLLPAALIGAVCGAAGETLVLAIAPANASGLSVAIMGLVAISSAGLVVAEYWAAALQALGRFRSLALFRVAQCLVPGLAMVTGVVIAGLPGGLTGFAVGTLAFAAPSLIWWLRLGINDESPARTPWSFLLVTNLSLTLLFLAYRADVFLLGGLSSSAQVGYYTAGVAVGELTLVLSLSVAVVRSPRYASDPGLSPRRDLLGILAASAVTAAVIGLLAPVVIPWFFGPSFRPSVTVAELLLPGMVMLALYRFLCTVEMVTRHKRGVLASALASIVVDFAILAVLAPHLGARAAAIAASASYATAFAVLLTWRIARIRRQRTSVTPAPAIPRAARPTGSSKPG